MDDNFSRKDAILSLRKIKNDLIAMDPVIEIINGTILDFTENNLKTIRTIDETIDILSREVGENVHNER